MDYRFIILTSLCLHFWINPIFAEEKERGKLEEFVSWVDSKINSPSNTVGTKPVLPKQVEHLEAAPPTDSPAVPPKPAEHLEAAPPTDSPAVPPKPAEHLEAAPPTDSPAVPPKPAEHLEAAPAIADQPTPPKPEDHGCVFIGAHAIADWLNSINIGSFFDYTSRHLKRNDECFALFDTDKDLTIWVEPYGFNAHYRSPAKSEKVDLTLSSIGAGVGARYALFDQIHLGGGAGYFRSNFDAKGDKGAQINGFYFGPSAEYLFSQGSVGFMIMGIGNFYTGKRSIKGKDCNTIAYDNQSWDVDMRLEVEYDLNTPAIFFIKDLTIHPSLRIDYLNVFEQGSHKKLEGEEKLDLKDRHSSFLYSKLSVRFDKMVFNNKTIFLTANLDVGWINMTPLSSDAFVWKAQGKDKVTDLTTESKNLGTVGLEFIGVHHNGLLAGIGYQASMGSSFLMQTGRVRVEWNW